MEEKLIRILFKLEEGVILVEEEIEVKSFLQYISEDGEGGPPTNNTAGASVLEPVVKKKDIKKYQKMALRSVPVEMK